MAILEVLLGKRKWIKRTLSRMQQVADDGTIQMDSVSSDTGTRDPGTAGFEPVVKLSGESPDYSLARLAEFLESFWNRSPYDFDDPAPPAPASMTQSDRATKRVKGTLTRHVDRSGPLVSFSLFCDFSKGNAVWETVTVLRTGPDTFKACESWGSNYPMNGGFRDHLGGP